MKTDHAYPNRAGGLTTAWATRLLPLLVLLALPAVAKAQFHYTIIIGTITIAGGTGPGGEWVANRLWSGHRD